MADGSPKNPRQAFIQKMLGEGYPKVEAIIAWLSSAEGQADAKRDEDEWVSKRQAEARAREDAKAKKANDWAANHAFLWMLEPVPYFDEDTESTAWMPMADSTAEVEAIRACAREWALGDKNRELHSHLFDNLAHFNMDWQSIVRRENLLRMEQVDGILFSDKNEPFGSW